MNVDILMQNFGLEIIYIDYLSIHYDKYRHID